MKNKYAKLFIVKKWGHLCRQMANFSFYVAGYICKQLHENMWSEHAYFFKCSCSEPAEFSLAAPLATSACC